MSRREEFWGQISLGDTFTETHKNTKMLKALRNHEAKQSLFDPVLPKYSGSF